MSMGNLINGKRKQEYGTISPQSKRNMVGKYPFSDSHLRFAKLKAISSPNSPYFMPFTPPLTSKSALPSPNKFITDCNSINNPNIENELIIEDDNKKDQINTWQAGFTVVNLFLGLCLLSYPYALMCGSFLSLIIFIFISFALCYTGKLIVRCFLSLSDDVEHSYPMVGYYSFKRFGYYLISIGIIAELFGALCTNTIFLWTNLSYLLMPYGLTKNEIIVICSVISLPTCWMLNFSQLSINSFLGCVCKIFTAIVVFVTFFLNLDTVNENIATKKIDIYPTSIQSFCISIGIYIMSFSGHPCLPSIYRAMKKPEQFEKMLDYCFIIMGISYVLISVFGYLTFGTNTNIIITGNLLDQNIYLSKTLIILVVAGCYFQISPLIAVMAEIPENNVFKITTNVKLKTRIFRTFLFLFICLVSYVAMDKLQFLEAITGSICTMIVSVICPALFYYKLFLYKNPKKKKKVMVPTVETSPMFVAKGSFKYNHIINGYEINNNDTIQDNIKNCIDNNKKETNENDDQLGLRIILYLYVIIGTIFGCYMFVTDLINAIHQ